MLIVMEGLVGHFDDLSRRLYLILIFGWKMTLSARRQLLVVPQRVLVPISWSSLPLEAVPSTPVRSPSPSHSGLSSETLRPLATTLCRLLVEYQRQSLFFQLSVTRQSSKTMIWLMTRAEAVRK